MPSEFESWLLPELKKVVPDLQPEQPIEGLGKKWVANLFSKKESLVIEACARNVVRTGKIKSSIQHYEKFYSMVLKLVDIKARYPRIKPVMIWKEAIPAHSTDLGLCSAWGVYVASSKEFDLAKIVRGATPNSINRISLSYLIRRNDAVVPRWRWLTSERRRSIQQMLSHRAMGLKEIAVALGLDYAKKGRDLSGELRDLARDGRVLKLMPGYVRGHGAVYGTHANQLLEYEKRVYSDYKDHKRNQRLGERILEILRSEGPMPYQMVMKRLVERYGMNPSRENVIGILSRNLVHRRLVRVTGPPKKRIYAAGG